MLGAVVGLLSACAPDVGDDAEVPLIARCQDPCACAERQSAQSGAQGSAGDESQGAAAARIAVSRTNYWRTSMGLTALRVDERLERAAGMHADFLARNPQGDCWPNAHRQTQGSRCVGFTGVSMTDRVEAAGYPWQRASEVISWEGSPDHSVDAWIWTVYHRQPLFDWRLQDAGFARRHGPLEHAQSFHNVMVMGVPRSGRLTQPPAAPVVFPAPGQTGVPLAFRGDLETPVPLAPGGRTHWPQGLQSGPVISVHFPTSDWKIGAHGLYLSSAGGRRCEAVPHTFASRDNDPNLAGNGGSNDVFLYADAPLRPGTEYVVQIVGTDRGGHYERTWAFETE